MELLINVLHFYEQFAITSYIYHPWCFTKCVHFVYRRWYTLCNV